MGTCNGLEVGSLALGEPPFASNPSKINMASGIFIGLEECELLAIRSKAVALITEGKTLMSYSDSGSSASKQFAMPPKEMLSEANWALYQLDPRQYANLKRTNVIGVRWDSRAL